MSWIIYVLKCPRTKTIRYVGYTSQTADGRLRRHIRESLKRNRTHKQRWIVSLFTIGLIPEIEILERGSGDGWADAERRWIAFYRRTSPALLNRTDGGEYPSNWGTHEERSAVAKQREARRTPAQRSASARKREAQIAPEERTAKARHAMMSLTPEERRISGKHAWEHIPAETRSEMARARMMRRTAEQRHATAVKREAAKTPEQRRADTQNGRAALTLEQQRAFGKQSHEAFSPEERSARARHAALIGARKRKANNHSSA